MTDKFKVITDMAVLMTWHNLHRGASSFMVLDWCTWAVNAGHVEYVYDGDEMIGFMDWVRSSYIPSNHDTDYQAIINSPAIDTGEIGIVLNCCVVRGKDTLRKLIKMARAKNETCQLMCWHDRKMSRMRYFSWHPHKSKGEICSETVVC